MNPSSAFRARLQKINAEVLEIPFQDLSTEMAQTTESLRIEYGDISRGAVDQQGIAAAVIQFLKSLQLPSYRDIKYVCFGISSPYGDSSTRLIEHKTLFPKILDEVLNLLSEPRKFRRCYQGLLKGYFRYTGQSESVQGHKNWLVLRGFLEQHCTMLKQQKPILVWTQTLYEHRNLLADSPCQPYAKALLSGDMSVVDELKTKLGIDDDTWVMNELVMAQVQAATLLKDADFILQVTPMVQVLEQHSGLVTMGLALLLKRYEACNERPIHTVLSDAALKQWKSPWLEANKPLWHAQIGETATQMVRLWLTKQHIKDFFELLQSDRQADKERMAFWLQYAESIEDFWLALGSNSFYNQQADYKRIRTQMEGHCMQLVDSNQSNDNAFLMKIGGFIFIEFGKQNNACHIFTANDMPFKLGQKYVSGTQDGLKNTVHPGHRKKLTHREGWQYEFAQFLRVYANANPNKDNYIVAPSVSKIISNTPEHTIKSTDIKNIEAFCFSRNLQFEDHREKGGAYWVFASKTHAIGSLLKSAGFRYKEGKGWWRE